MATACQNGRSPSPMCEWQSETRGTSAGAVPESIPVTTAFDFPAWRTDRYLELLEDSRRHAMDRMIENARIMDANAVIGMRFDLSEIGQSRTEIVAYGTAVVVVAW